MVNTRYQVKEITIESDPRRLQIEWGDEHVSRFHFVWLRHSEVYSDTLLTSGAEDCRNLPDDPLKLMIKSVRITATDLVLQWES